MGLSDGLIRFSIGLDDDIERTFENMKACMQALNIYSIFIEKENQLLEKALVNLSL